jgi:hypothetical protein
MPTVFTISINSISVKDENHLQDVVKEVEYIAYAENANSKVSLVESVRLDSANSESFTAYGDLTKTQITEWIEQSNNYLQVKNRLETLLSANTTNEAPVKKKFPWATANTTIG